MSIDEMHFMIHCLLVDIIAGFLDMLFSWKFYVPISRLTYSIYLIHVTIIQSYMCSITTPGYLSDYNMVSNMTVAFDSLIRPAVQVMTRQSKPCLSTQLQSLRQSQSRCLHVTPAAGRVALRPTCCGLHLSVSNNQCSALRFQTPIAKSK